MEIRPDVAWVRVQLHPDTFYVDKKGNIHCELAGEAIAICTTSEPGKIANAADCDALCSDGVIEGWVASLNDFCDVPMIPNGYHVVSLVWD